jgi:glutaminyl-peptide cyclotransferase
MELANHMKDLQTNVGVDFVLFDGEEYIFEPDRDKYFFGSEYFAQSYRQRQSGVRYLGAVLLDMIAGKDARFLAEQHSWMQAGALVHDLWNIAGEQNCAAFVNKVGDGVLDDHLALNQAGIPTVDIIPAVRNEPKFGFQYPHWHRLSDVPANCSPEPMSQVAKVLSIWMQRVK